MQKSNKLLVKNATIVTLDAANEILKHSALAVDGSRLLAVGNVPATFQPDETIDGHDRIAVLPGFFNCHTHAAMTLMRGAAEDLPVERWLNEAIWPAEAGLQEEDIYWGTALAACEMIRSGTVAFNDHYFQMHQVARMVEESGMKATLATCIFDANAEQQFELAREFARQYNNTAGGRIKTFLGPHSEYACSQTLLERFAKLSSELQMNCHIHVSETADQIVACREKTGRTPVQYLSDVGVLKPGTVAAHTIHVNNEDIAILKQQQVHVVQCPKTHLKMAMSTTRVVDLLSQGIPVALGTDGCASNNTMDMLEAIRLCALSQKHDRVDPTAMPQHEVLKMATKHGAVTMGFESSGSLVAGASADFSIINMDKPHLTPCHDIVSNLVYSARPEDVDSVVCDGKFILRNGVLTTLDEEKIMTEVRHRAARLVSKR